MGAGSSVEEVPGGGTEGYHVLRVRNLIIALFVSAISPHECLCCVLVNKLLYILYTFCYCVPLVYEMFFVFFNRCKIIPQGIRLAWSHSLILLWPLKILDWYI